MRSPTRVLLLAVVLSFLPGLASAQIYKYKDKNGNEIFTNDFYALPKVWQSYYEARGMKPAPTTATATAAEDEGAAEARKARQEARLEAMDKRLKAGKSLGWSKKAQVRYWQRRNWAAQRELAALQERHAQLNEQANKLTWLAPRRRTGALDREQRRRLRRLLARLDDIKKRIAKTEHDLNVVIPEGARKDGVPPGALREPLPEKKKARR